MGRILDRLTGADLHQKAMRPEPPHHYRRCRDDDCGKSFCRVYKEGYEAGDDDGYRRGYAAALAASGK